MFKYCYLLFALVYCSSTPAQSTKIDSLQKILQTQKQDTNRVTLLWKLAVQYQFFKPDTTLQLAQQALLLAKHLKYTEGESRSLGLMATGQYLLGNYAGALNNYMLKLQIEEKRNSSGNYLGALNNIGLMYILLADYPKALKYLYKADSTVKAGGAVINKQFQNSILVNLGETFYRMKRTDSANKYFLASLKLAVQNADSFHEGASRLGLGNVQAANGYNSEALTDYQLALPFLNDGTNNDMLCETALGLANVFQKTNMPDSSLHYAMLAFDTARKDGFLSRELDAANFLSLFFKNKNDFDNAFYYLELGVVLQDSIKGQAKTREAMMISSNEQLRQAEIAEQKKRDKETRLQQLQLLSICIFIPAFFILTVAVSRVRIHKSVVRFMGVVSLLLFFEFLVLLLHPLIEEFTRHNKVLELLILVIIGAGLVPLHHKLEHLILDKLTKTKGPQYSLVTEIDMYESEGEQIPEPPSSIENPNIDIEVKEIISDDTDKQKSAPSNEINGAE